MFYIWWRHSKIIICSSGRAKKKGRVGVTADRYDASIRFRGACECFTGADSAIGSLFPKRDDVVLGKFSIAEINR